MIFERVSIRNNNVVQRNATHDVCDDDEIENKRRLNISKECQPTMKKINRISIYFQHKNVNFRVFFYSENKNWWSFAEEIKTESEHLFDDVSDEFSQYKQIQNLFEQWKYQQNESYMDAFIEICLPKLFSPLIRREMIDWTPFEVSLLKLNKFEFEFFFIGIMSSNWRLSMVSTITVLRCSRWNKWKRRFSISTFDCRKSCSTEIDK